MPKKPQPKTPAVADKANVLQLTARDGISEQRQLADLATDGVAVNAMTARYFLGTNQPGLSITEMVDSLKEHGRRVNENDLAAQEQMLTAQAIALNTIFAELSRRSALNMGEYLDASERYMRLALKAQRQCRATVETLAAIKNPPVVYAKQANFASGPQQVNNGLMSGPNGEPVPAGAHEKTESQPSKLLEETTHGGKVLDPGTAATAARGDSTVETMGAVHGAHKSRG